MTSTTTKRHRWPRHDHPGECRNGDRCLDCGTGWYDAKRLRIPCEPDSGAILLHRVTADPVHAQLAGALREATYAGDEGSLGAILCDVGPRLGVPADAAARSLGLRFGTSTLDVIPDGIRACWQSKCTHAPGYVPAA